MPVAVLIGLASLFGIQASNANMLISVKEMFSAINKFPLAAIPYFILAGNLTETGGIYSGIYGGIFTQTEAATVAVFYALVVGIVVYRKSKLPDLYNIFRKSVLSRAAIMFIIANAGLFAFLITRAGVPDTIGHDHANFRR